MNSMGKIESEKTQGDSESPNFQQSSSQQSEMRNLDPLLGKHKTACNFKSREMLQLVVSSAIYIIPMSVHCLGCQAIGNTAAIFVLGAKQRNFHLRYHFLKVHVKPSHVDNYSKVTLFSYCRQ